MTPVVQNGCDFNAGPLAPGEIVTLRGYAFGPEAPASGQTGSDGRFSNELAGVRVLFDDTAAPLLYVQSNQINTIVPWQLSGRTSVNVHVEYNGVSTNTAAIPVADTAPGIFLTDYYAGQGAVLNQDGTVNSRSNPAKRGSIVSIFATGGGLLNPPLPDGSVTPIQPPFPQVTLPIQVLFGGGAGEPVEVLYAGAAPGLVSGVIQINARIPNDPEVIDVSSPIDVIIGGQVSAFSVESGTTAFIWIQ